MVCAPLCSITPHARRRQGAVPTRVFNRADLGVKRLTRPFWANLVGHGDRNHESAPATNASSTCCPGPLRQTRTALEADRKDDPIVSEANSPATPSFGAATELADGPSHHGGLRPMPAWSAGPRPRIAFQRQGPSCPALGTVKRRGWSSRHSAPQPMLSPTELPRSYPSDRIGYSPQPLSSGTGLDPDVSPR